MTHSKHCPVCNALVDDDQISAVYRGHEFWFCSRPCRDRLKILPELFIGNDRHQKHAEKRLSA